MKPDNARFLSAVFCDDIRHELGNKISLMGCYQRELIVHDSSPSGIIALPKLCVFATAWTTTEHPFKRFTLHLIQDGQTELGKVEVPVSQPKEESQPTNETASFQQLNALMTFAPFVVDRSMILEIIGRTETGELRGPRLLITVKKVEAEPATVSARKSRTSGRKRTA